MAAPDPEFAGERWTAKGMNALPHPEGFEGRRLFLPHGEIWEQGIANATCDSYLWLASKVLERQLPEEFLVRGQLGMDLADDTQVMPDILVVKASFRDFLVDHPTTADLIVEMSDATLFFDTTTKAELYATAGVPDYWVLDVNARTPLVLRDPAPINGSGHAYRSLRTLTETDSVVPLATPNVQLRAADLLP